MEEFINDLKLAVEASGYKITDDRFYEIITQELMRSKYVKLPDDSEIWSRADQISVCRLSSLMDCSKMIKAVYLFLKQNNFINDFAGEKLDEFVKNNFGVSCL